MNIFALGSMIGIFVGAIAGYNFVAPYGVVYGVFAAVAGAILGFFGGHIAGFVFLLPFEGAARLGRFFSTGHWTEPPQPEAHKQDVESGRRE